MQITDNFHELDSKYLAFCFCFELNKRDETKKVMMK